MADPFRVRVTVRGYELDAGTPQPGGLPPVRRARPLGCLRASGIGQDRLLAGGVGPVALRGDGARYLRELRGGDEVDVTCEFHWGEARRSGSAGSSPAPTAPRRVGQRRRRAARPRRTAARAGPA
ncbi:hypothetical protein V2I01_36585 [Micromonospora sp. BRA006-A]|nr:hypothetical protein [Micromonospora sp. BRA006-A]